MLQVRLSIGQFSQSVSQPVLCGKHTLASGGAGKVVIHMIILSLSVRVFVFVCIFACVFDCSFAISLFVGFCIGWCFNCCVQNIVYFNRQYQPVSDV